VAGFSCVVPCTRSSATSRSQRAALAKPAYQRHVKRAPQVAIEALDLALGLGPVWLAQFDDEAAVLGKVEEAGVVAVLAFAVHIAPDHDRLHVAVQDLARHAAERGEGALVATDQRGHLHVADELHVAGAAVAHRGAERVQRCAAFAELAQSTCNCSSIAVSKRTSGSTGNAGRNERMNACNWFRPHW
jgi:hypothetical protein